jgi:hypothetical protein
MTTSIYSAIEAIARQVTIHYMTDITIHDKALCATLQTGNAALWCARPCGSHWVWIVAPTDRTDTDIRASLRTRLEFFDAVNTVWPNCRWHVLRSTDGPCGDVVPCTTEEARALLLDQIRALEQMARSEPIPA